LVDVFGETKVVWAEKNLAVVQRFFADGIIGIWEWIKDQADSLITTMKEGMKGWLLKELVEGFTKFIATLLIPGGAIIKLIEGIY
jgi:hypothetical protein